MARERFYETFGTTANGRRAPSRGPAQAADVIVVIGEVTFGNVRGSSPAAAKSLAPTLRELGYCVVKMDEYLTSKKCDACGAFLKRTRGWSIRHWRCEHDEGAGEGSAPTRDGKVRHPAEQVCVIVMFVCEH